MQPSLEIIVAVDTEGGFGKGGQIPWSCKEDMKRFTNISKQCGVTVMGRHTYADMLNMQMNKDGAEERIKTKGILPGRTSFVVSSTLKQEDVIGAEVVPDLHAVLNKYFETDQRIAVIGGEKLYVQALATAAKIHMTVMDRKYGCDRFLPIEYVRTHFGIVAENSHAVNTDVDGTTKTIHFITYARTTR